MVSLEVVALVLTGLGLTASIVYYANVLRNTNKQRMTQFAMNLSSILISPETTGNTTKILSYTWDDFEDFRKNTIPLLILNSFRLDGTYGDSMIILAICYIWVWLTSRRFII